MTEQMPGQKRLSQDGRMTEGGLEGAALVPDSSKCKCEGAASHLSTDTRTPPGPAPHPPPDASLTLRVFFK